MVDRSPTVVEGEPAGGDRSTRSGGNAFGLLRLLLAGAVVASHAAPLGYALPNPLSGWSRQQTDLGSLALLGFFTISGFLVTGSGRRLPVGRYLWHRALRILPGLWACLLVMAFGLGPALWWRREHTLSGYLALTPGPLDYLRADWTTAMTRYGIGDLLADTPYGRGAGSVFNGSLWSLRYELTCYLAVAALALLGALRRRPELVAALFGALWALRLAGGDSVPRFLALGPIGTLSVSQMLPLALAFGFGAVAAVRPQPFVPDHRFATAAAAVAVLSLRFGRFDTVGLPAFAYVVLWAGLRLPARLHRIGTRHDLSYGIYIYGFPIQQCLALGGLPRRGLLPYLAATLALSAAAALASWHLVERPALRLKGLRTVPRRRPQPVDVVVLPEVASVDVTSDQIPATAS